MNAHKAEIARLKDLVTKLEGTVADMLKTQRPILRDALRYQVLRESQRDAVVVILSSAGGHMAEPHQVDIAVDQLMKQKSVDLTKEAA